jgi:hypothetical protein
MSASTPPTTTLPADVDVLTEAAQLPIISKLQYLLRHTKALVHSHGPYTTHTNTTVFIRASQPVSKPYGPSSRCMASSLAAAQDCIGSAQVTGPAREDLHIFKHLWDTTIDVLEEVLATGDLDHESFGWGIWGMCAGYIYPPSEASYEVFEEQKNRLHGALLELPTMDAVGQKKTEVVNDEGMPGLLVKANRQVHICANLVLQRFRKEGWHRIRWWHGVKVAERWVARLDLADDGKLASGKHEKEQLREPATNKESIVENRNLLP